MANNPSAEKCIRQSERHRLHNKYYAKTTRNAIRAIRNTTDKAAVNALNKVEETNSAAMSKVTGGMNIPGFN